MKDNKLVWTNWDKFKAGDELDIFLPWLCLYQTDGNCQLPLPTTTNQYHAKVHVDLEVKPTMNNCVLSLSSWWLGIGPNKSPQIGELYTVSLLVSCED